MALQLFGGLFENTSADFRVQLDFSRNNLSRASKNTVKWNYAGADSCVAALAGALHVARRVPVVKLLLEHCGLGPAGVGVLCAALASRNPAELRVLSLRGNLLAPGGREVPSSPELTSALSQLTFTVNALPLVALHLVRNSQLTARACVTPSADIPSADRKPVAQTRTWSHTGTIPPPLSGRAPRIGPKHHVSLTWEREARRGRWATAAAR